MLSELDLHITNRCTTACRYCCFSSNRLALSEMTFKDIILIIDDAIKLGCKHIHFTGGEPLLREDILEIIRYCCDKGISMRLQTNGMLLSSQMARKLKQAGLSDIMISLDSDRSKEHDEIRGIGTWSSAVRAIYNAQEEGLNVRVNSVISKANWERIIPTIQLVHDLDLKTYSAFYFSPIGEGKNMRDLWIEPDEYIKYWDSITEEIRCRLNLGDMNIVIEKGYVNWNDAKLLDITGFTGCGGGCLHTYNTRDYLIVRCDGNVYPCIMGIDGVALGNTYDSSLKEIYMDAENWERLIPHGDDFCLGCEHYELCGEGCRFYPQIESGHDCRCVKEKLVPLCPIMKYNLKNNVLGGSSDDVV